jgi:long-chain acyl-CoA synthetase
MQRETLLDFFDDLARIRGDFLVFDDGYRSRTWTYGAVARAAGAFAARLRGAGIRKGETVVIWSENRPEWIVALWGCLLEGVIFVPIDYRSSAAFLRRVQAIVQARALLVGHDVQLPGDADATLVWALAEACEAPAADAPEAPRPPIGRDDIAEIIFTSGATAEPKGVTITHRNILANIVPIEREMAKYRKYARPFMPLRFLNLLPLSHMFGQAMATFIPPMLDGVVVFERGYNPHEIVRQIQARRISVLVCVPKLLGVLADHVRRLVPEAAGPAPPKAHWTRRWWRYRRAHDLFGWKFWCCVVGAAPLESELEEFWSRLGFLVVQGYGLTETAPIVTLNHPLRASRGTVGTPIGGVEVRLAPDGEILVRGENVTRGYFNAPADTAEAFRDGWLHTGDIGAFDAEGRLLIRGRKKEMIVTPQGLNVFPEDVERELNGQPGVVESAVAGVRVGGEERVHAALVVRPGADLDDIVRRANAGLEDHQKVRTAAVWPGDALPRTEGTRKLRRREVQRWLSGAEPAAEALAAEPARSVEAALARFAGGRAITDGTTLDELGLSSLERVELLLALEEHARTTIEEAAFSGARTVGDLRALVDAAAGTPAAPGAPAETAELIEFPAWNQSWLARAVRRVSLPTWILPLARVFVRIRVEGAQHLEAVRGPVIFAANHQSHLDTPAILAALPAAWRYRVATAMAKEFFRAHFFPKDHSRRQWLTNSLNYWLAALFFNAFPLPQRETGTRQTLRYAGDLLNRDQSILIFPEGKRNPTGRIGRFLPGVAMIAVRLGVPVVPVRLDGLDAVLAPEWKMARPGRVRVAFGPLMHLSGDDYAALAARVEEAVRGLQAMNTELTRN